MQIMLIVLIGLHILGGVFWAGGSEWPPDGRTPWAQICGDATQPMLFHRRGASSRVDAHDYCMTFS